MSLRRWFVIFGGAGAIFLWLLWTWLGVQVGYKYDVDLATTDAEKIEVLSNLYFWENITDIGMLFMAVIILIIILYGIFAPDT